MKNFFSRFQRFPHFLYLLPLFFVFHGYSQNRSSVTWDDFFSLWGEYLLAAAALFLLGWLLYRQWPKAALFSFGLLFFHLFFGAFHDGLKVLSPGFFLAKYSILLPIIFIGLVLFVFILKRTNNRFRRLFLYLNLVFLVLFLIDVPALFRNSDNTAMTTTLQPCKTCPKPDVYLIIADEYADSVSLSQVFNFNNGAFQDSLRRRGFHIVDSSQANYNFTPFVMASMFGMNYLQNLEGSNSSRKDMNLSRGLVNENELIAFFHKSGYETRNFSIFNFDNKPTPARQNYVLIGKDLITSHTFLQRLQRDIGYHLVTTLKLKAVINRYTFYIQKCNDKLLGLLQGENKLLSKKPRLIYTHLVMPHYPYYYDKNGKPRPPEYFRTGYEFDKAAYLEYLQYNNGLYLRLLDDIFQSSQHPPIIIFMGDHGFREFSNPTPEERRYYFMNLNAVYLPNGNYKPFYRGISGVNQFRALLNASFGQRLPMLKDSTSFLLE